MIDNSKEYILCAAIKRIIPNNTKPYHEGENDICEIEIGYRHHDIYQRFADTGVLSKKAHDQGFYTSKGRFVDRYEATEIAYRAGQIDAKKAFDNHEPFPFKDADGREIEITSDRKFYPLFSEDLY